jgi:hypothetical protein
MKLNSKYYFQHDYNSRSDGKMIEIRMKHGMCGVGTYWSMVEMLHENEGYIDLKPNRLAYELGTDEQMINDIVELCFSVVDDKITCNRVIENLNHRIEIKEKKSNAGKTGMANRWNKNNPNGVITEVLQSYNSVITDDNSVITKHNIDIDIDIDIDKGKGKGIEIGKDKEIDKNKGKGIDIQKLKQQKLNEQKIRICKQLVEEGLFTNEYILTASLSDIREIISGVLDNEKWETEYLSGQYEFQLKLEDTNVWDYQIDALIKLYKLL